MIPVRRLIIGKRYIITTIYNASYKGIYDGKSPSFRLRFRDTKLYNRRKHKYQMDGKTVNFERKTLKKVIRYEKDNSVVTWKTYCG